MTYGMDDVTFTSTGASATDEVQLNSGTSLSAPDPAHAFNAVVFYQMELGAFTVDESLLTAFRIQSDDVAIEPKKGVLANINTGDAAFTSVAAPALLAYPINTPLAGGEHLHFYAQPSFMILILLTVQNNTTPGQQTKPQELPQQTQEPKADQ